MLLFSLEKESVVSLTRDEGAEKSFEGMYETYTFE